MTGIDALDDLLPLLVGLPLDTVDVTIEGGNLTLGTPTELFQIVQNVVAWDAAGDHSRFLLATRPELASEPLHVVLNWLAQ